MPLKKSAGNMYTWTTHTHTHLAGECPHKCKYCYAQKGVARLSGRYKGEPRLVESELNINYGTGKTIFVEHMNDLFALGIKDEWRKKILNHCMKYPDNRYVFQTKNPKNAEGWFGVYDRHMLGTTIETNRQEYNFSQAPSPCNRYLAMKTFKLCGWPIFVTIEPIMDFDIDTLSKWLIDLKPDFVNIGADSKKCNLPEPSAEKIQELIKILNENKIAIKKKSNLRRLLE